MNAYRPSLCKPSPINQKTTSNAQAQAHTQAYTQPQAQAYTQPLAQAYTQKFVADQPQKFIQNNQGQHSQQFTQRQHAQPVNQASPQNQFIQTGELEARKKLYNHENKNYQEGNGPGKYKNGIYGPTEKTHVIERYQEGASHPVFFDQNYNFFFNEADYSFHYCYKERNGCFRYT